MTYVLLWLIPLLIRLECEAQLVNFSLLGFWKFEFFSVFIFN